MNFRNMDCLLNLDPTMCGFESGQVDGRRVSGSWRVSHPLFRNYTFGFSASEFRVRNFTKSGQPSSCATTCRLSRSSRAAHPFAFSRKSGRHKLSGYSLPLPPRVNVIWGVCWSS